MQTIKIGTIGAIALVAALTTGQLATAQQAPTPKPAQPSARAPKTTAPSATMRDPAANAALKEMEKELGFVPQFVRSMPEHIVPVFWQSMKSFEMNPNTKLDAKTKQLIGLAVAAQIPCTYCVQFHTEAARTNGASDEEIKEAVGMAAITRLGSTLLNGGQVDMGQFTKDLERLNRNAQAKNGSTSPQARSSTQPRR
jgi:AhpD family alkylhydroperoxidase